MPRSRPAIAETEGCEPHVVDAGATQRLMRRLPPDAVIRRVAELFGCMADPTRCKIILALASGEACPHELAELIGMTPPAVSHHLRVLRSLRLVSARRVGKRVYYSLDDEHVKQWIQQCVDHASEE